MNPRCVSDWLLHTFFFAAVILYFIMALVRLFTILVHYPLLVHKSIAKPGCEC